MDLDKNTVRQVFELEKTAVNQTDLAARIYDKLKTYDLETPIRWPAFALDPDVLSYDISSISDLREALNKAIKEYDKIWLELAIPASDKSFTARIKRPFHQLVLFYVNKIGQKQIKFNDRLLRIVNQLIASEEKKDGEIEALHEQLADLKKRIEALEQKQS